ncbi:MAG TPA: N-acetylmuramoyl-L-alanine amidase [Symbiobacteriaceae bacterium]|nr:N-acetylmuramoyl-L-alanine amidase [Symbiobacteriaceae bacterium]
MQKWLRVLASVLVLLLLTTSAYAGGEEFARGDKLDGALGKAFTQASRAHKVPVEILVAVAYAETHFDDHGGQPSVSNGYGVMHLVDNPGNQSLNEAARHASIPAEKIKTDPGSNVRAAAALLAAYARELNGGKLPESTADWFDAVAKYSGLADRPGQKAYAEQVYTFINQGIDATAGPEELRLEPRSIQPNMASYAGDVSIMSTDYGPALWAPANSGNYTAANRESDYNINYVIIHVTQGSYSGAISWFQNASANVSAHYVIRSSDGQVTQSVREKDIAWHAGNWTYNTQSIGIEHEGYVSNCSWFTDAMYRSSAALTRSVALKYNIPMDRSHIIGHNEVPGATHTDPGSCWNWTYYMQLVTQSSTWSTIIDNNNTSRVTASANWGVSTYSSQRYGADYFYANPLLSSDPVSYQVNIPATASYDIYMWYPANSGYNASTPVIIHQANSTNTGTTAVTTYVNQQTNGGKWVLLGTYRLLAGDRTLIQVSRWTSSAGYVIADAFKIVRK